MSTTTLTNEDEAILMRLRQRGTNAIAFEREARDSIDYRAMLARRTQIERDIAAGLAQDYDGEVIGMALQAGLLKLAAEAA